MAHQTEPKKKTQEEMYPSCKCIPRPCPDMTVDEELIKRIATEFRTLPSFENTTYQSIYRKYYSLQTNELLKCRWKEYKSHIEERTFAPFQFPNNRDNHFINGSIKICPERSEYHKSFHGFKMRPGPGVDYRGQLPIPYELFMKRGLQSKKPRPVLKRVPKAMDLIKKKKLG